MQLAGRWRKAACAVAAAVVLPSRARAEIREASERLAEAWRSVGAVVVLSGPRFLGDDNGDQRPLVVALPTLPDGACTTVVLLAARGLGFHVRVGGAGAIDPDGKHLRAIAGAVSVERCGDTPPRKLYVASDTGRGAIETVVARSSRPLPSIRTVLPERSGGALLPVGEPGALPPLTSPEKRADSAEARAKRDGAVIAPRIAWRATIDGTGAERETLEPGCHALELFAVDPRAEQPSQSGRLDLDAEIRDGADDRVLARDRSDAPDAQLSTCVGESTGVDIAFAGAPPRSSVLVAHAAWPLPQHLPRVWGSEAQGRMAQVLLARHVVSLPHEPVALAQGGSGVTPIPLWIQPGACYLAVALLVKEASRTVGLRVHIGARDAFDDRGVDGDGAAVAFCAGAEDHALAEVEARGALLLGWGFALYRFQSNEWEVAK